MSEEEDIYNEIFSALKHPIRRRILTILEESPKTFTYLLNDLGIDSGLLTYHLENLGSLIGKTDNGHYRISKFGLAAIGLTKNIENPPRISPIRKKLLNLNYSKNLMTIDVIFIVLSGFAFTSTVVMVTYWWMNYGIDVYELYDASEEVLNTLEIHELRVGDLDSRQYDGKNAREIHLRITISNPSDYPISIQTGDNLRVRCLNISESQTVGWLKYKRIRLDPGDENRTYMLHGYSREGNHNDTLTYSIQEGLDYLLYGNLECTSSVALGLKAEFRTGYSKYANTTTFRRDMRYSPLLPFFPEGSLSDPF